MARGEGAARRVRKADDVSSTTRYGYPGRPSFKMRIGATSSARFRLSLVTRVRARSSWVAAGGAVRAARRVEVVNSSLELPSISGYLRWCSGRSCPSSPSLPATLSNFLDASTI